MCMAVTCKTCGKTTWAGCGEHIDDVKAGVPAEQWCPGHPDGASAATTGDTKPGVLGRLFGR